MSIQANAPSLLLPLSSVQKGGAAYDTRRTHTHTHTHEVTHEELVENFQVLGTHAVYPTLNWWIAKCVLAAVFGGSNPLTISSSLEMFLA